RAASCPTRSWVSTKLAPEAFILNFTNPAGIVTEAVRAASCPTRSWVSTKLAPEAFILNFTNPAGIVT
ncbi:hypothetical protein CK247_31580, partial [Klebsiella pneumoniae]